MLSNFSSNDTDIDIVEVRISSPAVTASVAFGISSFLLGLACNALVIATILRTRSLKTSSINQAVLSLCVADVVTVLLDVPATSIILLLNHLGAEVSPSRRCNSSPRY